MPKLGEVMTALLDDRAGQMTVVVPGVVTSWNLLTETATVAPTILGPDGASRPPVEQCPVVFPGAYWDLQVGETGILIACDEDFSTWWRTGQTSAPATEQSHRIGNAVFLPGFRASTNARTHKVSAAILDKPVALGEVLLGDPAADKAAVHEVLLADLDTFLAALDTWGAAVGPIVGVPWAPQASLLALRTGILADDYQSPSVKVEE